jgi:hypothetical protein
VAVGGRPTAHSSVCWRTRAPSVGGSGDRFDNVLAERVIAWFGTGVARRRGSWRSFEAVERTTPERADRYDHRRLPEPIGTVPPAAAETRYDARLQETTMAA